MGVINAKFIQLILTKQLNRDLNNKTVIQSKLVPLFHELESGGWKYPSNSVYNTKPNNETKNVHLYTFFLPNPGCSPVYVLFTLVYTK